MVDLPRKAKGERPVYLGDKAVDTLLSMVLNLAGEVVVLRERLDTAERLLDQTGTLRAAINDYRPPVDVIADREAWRAKFLDIVMGALQQERQELEQMKEPLPYSSVVEFVSTE